MRKLHLLMLAGLALLPLLSQEAHACQCGGFNTPYTVFEGADVVFVGKVVAVTDPSGNEVPDDGLPTIRNLRDNMELLYRFQVQERFKGAEAPEVTVETSINMCQFGFGKGGTWLVYAYKNANPKAPLAAGVFCSRTSPLPGAQVDLHFLNALLKGEAEPRIYGFVQLREPDPSGQGTRYSFLPGVTVVATNGRRRFTTVTDKNGIYRFDKLPNGKYKVAPTLPARYELDWLNIEEITLTNGDPNDELFNNDYRKFTGRNAFSGIDVVLKRKSTSERK